MPRTILVHLNIELPDSNTDTAVEIEREVQAALEVGMDPEGTPSLYKVATISYPLTEEI